MTQWNSRVAAGTGLLLVLVVGAAQGTVRTVVLVVLVLVLTAAAVFGDRSWVRGVGAGARVLLAITACGVGIAVGFGFARKSGPLLPTALGLALLFGGLALLALQARGFLRGTPGWWRLLIVPLGLVVLAGVYPVSFAVLATTPAPTPLGSATPASHGLSYTSVRFATSDGTRLSAWYVRSANGAAVVLLHGSGSNRTATLRQAAVLARHGFGVLMLDARGHGDSHGHGMDFGWYGESDAAAAVTWLTTQPDVRPDRIGVLGLSMGAEEAIGAAGADPRIRAVVAEGATARIAADKAHWLPGGPLGFLQRGLDRATYGLARLLTDAPVPRTLREAATRAAPRPMLLIAAGDVPDEGRAARAIRDGARGNVQVWVVPGAGHIEGLSTRPAEWEQRVVDFLSAALRPS